MVILSGAILMGCEDSGRHVYGDGTYHGDVFGNADAKPNVYGERSFHSGQVSGEREYRRTESMVRTDDDAVQPASSRTVTTTTNDRELNSASTGVTKADPERAAFATTAHYPNDLQASNDLKATALVERSAGSIKIANASDQPIRDAKLWVDGRYVVQVNDLPAHGTLSVNRTEFSDREGKLPADLKGVRQVQLQTKDNLYNLQGPVFDEK